MNDEVFHGDFEELIKKATPAFREMLWKEEEYLKRGLRSGELVLECGCGSGRILKAVLGVADTVIGIDFSQAQIESSKKNVPEGNVGIVPGDLMNLPFKDGLFDSAVMMFNTIGGFDDIEKFHILKEIKRVLKDGGKLILSAYAENAHPYQKKYYKNFGYDSCSRDGITYAYSKEKGSFKSETFTKKKIERILEEVGFEVIELKKLHDFSYIVKATPKRI